MSEAVTVEAPPGTPEAIEPAKTQAVEEQPKWIQKILRAQAAHNKRYEQAHAYLAEAWNDFLSSVAEINAEWGTDFTPKQALGEFGDQYAVEADLIENDDK